MNVQAVSGHATLLRPGTVLSIGAAAVALVALAAWPLFYSEIFFLHIGVVVLLSAISASGLHLIVRTGQLSFAHAAFIGLGAYTSVLATMRLGWPFPLALVAAAILPALVALGLGIVVLRLKGVYFVLSTFAFGELVRLVFVNAIWLTGGSNGIFDVPPPSPLFTSPMAYYYLALGTSAVLVFFVYRLLHSEVGRTLDAIRQGESLAQSTGVRVARFKIMAFAVGAALGGVHGSLLAHFIHYIAPVSYTWELSLSFLVINIVGGMKSLAGPLVGTIFLVPLPEILRGFVEYQRVLYGVILVLVMAFAPDGLVGLVHLVQRHAAKSGQPL